MNEMLVIEVRAGHRKLVSIEARYAGPTAGSQPDEPSEGTIFECQGLNWRTWGTFQFCVEIPTADDPKTLNPLRVAALALQQMAEEE